MKKTIIKHEKISAIDAYWIPAPPGTKGFIIKGSRKLRQYYRRWFQKTKHYVFMHLGPFDPPINPSCSFASYERFDDIPDTVKDAIIANEGKASLENEKFEMKHGASMWVGFVEGQLAHIILIRYGKEFDRWFVHLDDQDIVMFRGRTYPEYRGQGILGTAIKHIMHILLQDGGKAFTDINVHNISSIRGILKFGFENIAKIKPISRKQALGVDRE